MQPACAIYVKVLYSVALWRFGGRRGLPLIQHLVARWFGGELLSQSALIRHVDRGLNRLGFDATSTSFWVKDVVHGQALPRRRSKMEFTLIGDTVNVAARVEQLTKTTGDKILVTEHSVNALTSRPPELVDRGSHGLKGKSAAVPVFAWNAELSHPSA